MAFGYDTSNNNGNVLSQTITMPKQTSVTLTLQHTYGYDGVNRLQSAGETVAGDDDGVSAGQRQFREAAGRDVRPQAEPKRTGRPKKAFAAAD